MTRDVKKKIVTAGIIGGLIFCAIMMFANFFILKHEFSWIRLGLYFLFAFIMYSFLAYRSYKRKIKK